MNELLELLKNPAVLDGIFDAYKPTIYQLASKIFGVYKDFVANDEYYETVAKSQANLYRAYLSAGFTEDQAMLLILDHRVALDKAIDKSDFKVSYKK